MRPLRTTACALLAAALALSIPAASAATGPFDPGSWCPQGGVRIEQPSIPFIVPPPPIGYTWSLLVLASKGPAPPYVVADPVVGAAYVDPNDVPTDAILCQESTDPPTTTAAPTTTSEPTATTLIPTTTTLLTTETTTTIAAATTTITAPPTNGPPTSSPAAPPPTPPTPTGVPYTVAGSGLPPTTQTTPQTASEPPTPELSTTTQQTTNDTTTTERTPTSAATDTATTPAATADPTSAPARTAITPANSGINVATYHAGSVDLSRRHRSADGFVFFLLLAAVGAGVYFTGRHQR